MPSPRVRLAIAALAAVAAFTVAQVASPPPTPEQQVVTASAASEPVIVESEWFSPTTTAPPPTTSPPPPKPRSAPVVAQSAPTPTPTSECGGYVPLIQKYWPGDQINKVCSVIRCETGGTYSPTIENPSSTASGLLQFLDGTWRNARQYVDGASQYARASHAPAEVQIAVGAAWWSRTSWSQWSCA